LANSILAGVVAIAWGSDNKLQSFAVGVAFPLIVSHLARQFRS
jgi:hypothetical protein